MNNLAFAGMEPPPEKKVKKSTRAPSMALPVNLDKYDTFVIGISGGKDSSALALWMWYESGIDRAKMLFTFCDTQNEDPLTYAWLDLLNKHFSVEVVTTEGFFPLAKRKKRFLSIKGRFCTEVLKIIPSRDYVLGLLREDKNPVVVSGVRKAEGSANNTRGSMPELEFDPGWACDVWRPILRWTIAEVWAIQARYVTLAECVALVESDPAMLPEKKAKLIGKIVKNNTPRNPLYDMGASRVGCFPCMNSRKAEINSMAEYRPERIDEIEIWENDLTFDYRSDGGGEISSFFAKSTTPLRFRSKLIIVPDTKKKDYVPTIRDVVRWSYSGKRARGDMRNQLSLPIIDEPASACDIGGMCE